MYVSHDDSAQGDEHGLRIVVGKHASVHILERGGTTESCHTLVTAEVEEGGSLVYTYMDGAPLEARSVLRAVVRKNASCTLLFTTSSALRRYDASVSLVEEGASATVKGLAILPPHHKSFVNLVIEHQAAHTTSSQHCKGVIANGALGSFASSVVIRRAAQKSESHQHSRFLTLGPRAQTFNTPCFDIDADDVIAVHGATTGALDDELLFYLTSRGMSASDARRALVEGFCEEIIRALPTVCRDTVFSGMLSAIEGEV